MQNLVVKFDKALLRLIPHLKSTIFIMKSFVLNIDFKQNKLKLLLYRQV